MMSYKQKILLSLLLEFVAGSAFAFENRCGWLQNPTPANWWLNDKDGSWTLSVQGGHSVNDNDWNKLPKIKQNEFVRINNNYGYSCVCLRVDTNKKKKTITKIYGGKQLLLKKCLEDRSLPKP